MLQVKMVYCQNAHKSMFVPDKETLDISYSFLGQPT